jgi:DNA segregation ATPase FtsK/SpoIIIE, S-DNA-T family
MSRTRKRRRPRPRRTRRSRRGAVTSSWRRLGELEQRELDLIGLALVAAGVYFALVLYLGWDGGRVGAVVATVLRHLAGAVAYVLPVTLLAAGAAMVLRPFLPSLGPLKFGGVAMLAALLLAFAAGTAGLGGGGERHGYFQPDFFTERGGVLGEALYWSTSSLFQKTGAHVIALLLMFAGLLLLTGTSIAAFLRATGRALRQVKEQTGEFARVVIGDDDADLIDGETTDPMYGAPEPVFHGEELDAEAAEQPTDGEGVPAHSYDEELDGVPEIAEAGNGQPGPVVGEGDAGRTPMGNKRGGVTASEEIDYKLPQAKILERGGTDPGPDRADHEAVGAKLLEALGNFGVEAKIVGVVSGPHVSRFELRLAPGTKVAAISKLKDDLAYALASTDIRILAPIPGKQAVGVEVPNRRRRLVRLGDIYQDRPSGASPLVGWLGRDVDGSAVWTDLQKMPHVLVAGTTGSGKSACVNALICSILMHASPNEVRLTLVDPKRVELNYYESIPHLITPVVTAPRLAANVLANLIGEMESRYGIMSEAKSRNLAELNRVRRRAGEPPLPHILCVIDELADLMMIAPAEVEDSIIRLAQKSRAVGIHLVLATQRPSTDIITGTIKVNIPARIAFAVSSQVDSRVILDQGGAEALLGQGDMLFRPAGTSKLKRIQGAYVTEEEIARIAAHWASQGEPEYEESLLEARSPQPGEGEDEGEFSPDQDDLLEEAVRLVVQTQTASVSMIQRRLRVGYTRAGRLIDMLERRGVISGYEGSKPRQVLVGEADLHRILAGSEAASPKPAHEGEAEAEPATVA